MLLSLIASRQITFAAARCRHFASLACRFFAAFSLRPDCYVLPADAAGFAAVAAAIRRCRYFCHVYYRHFDG